MKRILRFLVYIFTFQWLIDIREDRGEKINQTSRVHYVHDTCRVCGCTEYNACQGGCYWIAKRGKYSLCSECGSQKNIVLQFFIHNPIGDYSSATIVAEFQEGTIAGMNKNAIHPSIPNKSVLRALNELHKESMLVRTSQNDLYHYRLNTQKIFL